MHLAHLPTAPMEWTLHSILDAFMAVWYDKINSLQSSIFQVREEVLSGQLILTVCNPGTQDLPDPVIPDARNHEQCFVGVLDSIPDFEIWGIYEKVGDMWFNGTWMKFYDLFIKFFRNTRYVWGW